MESVNALLSGVQPVLKLEAVPATATDEPGLAEQGGGTSAQAAPPTPADTRYLNDLLQQHQQHLAFSVDEASGHSVIKVIDTASGDVIRQMPSESWLKLAQDLARQAGGLLRTQA
ncbi:MAG: flagellar protein FlaG [Perlucidibaca sp.]